MTVGFIGFGEAAFSIASGLREEGAASMVCFDAMQADPRFQEAIAEKCRTSGAEQLPTAADVCRRAEVVIAAVPSGFAEAAAEEALPGLQAGALYMDVSTATPGEKKRISQQVEARGGRFVDAAMMGTLLKDRHQVPMLLCGSGAAAFQERMAGFHMNLTLVEGEPGTATSIKFIRSITAKGLSCLLLESLQAAKRFGVEEVIAESFLDSFGPSFARILDGYVSGAVIHAVRREHEMQNVVDFLRQEGLPCTMAEATRQKLQWIQESGGREQLGGQIDRSWRAVIDNWKL